MSESVNLPALGESVTEGTVTRWLKNVGDRVEVDEPLLEVSTDKVDTEIPSPIAGVIEAILVAEDETVEVGTPLVTIGDGSGGGDEAPAAPAEEAPAAPAAAAPVEAAPEAPAAAPQAEAARRCRPPRHPPRRSQHRRRPPLQSRPLPSRHRLRRLPPQRQPQQLHQRKRQRPRRLLRQLQRPVRRQLRKPRPLRPLRTRAM
jgi:pyruvate dehydrogenase E2 component (dihydrolipoamide acetyltransferase)